jgi:hypothetical protein
VEFHGLKRHEDGREREEEDGLEKEGNKPVHLFHKSTLSLFEIFFVA